MQQYRRLLTLGHRSTFRHLLVLWIVVCAVAAALALWQLNLLHRRRSESVAAGDALNTGATIVGRLARQPEVASGDRVTDWTRFAALVEGLATVEPDLEYVGVKEADAFVFRKQPGLRGAVREEGKVEGKEANLPPRTDAVKVRRRMLSRRGADIPVLTFTKTAAAPGGTSKTVEVGVRREIVKRKATAPVAATTAMFRVAVTTISLTFGLCLVLVLWLLRRENAAEQRRRQQERLAFAGAMAGGVVHDFRNPLSSLKLDIQMLREEAGADAAARRENMTRLADNAMHTVSRMEEVLEQFLSLSSSEAEKKEAVDLGACIRECARILASRMERHGKRMDLDMQAEVSCPNADATSLRRAVLNVLTNAEEHTPPGEAVRIRLRADRRRAVIDVIDAGPGVPPGERERIFELFVSGRAGGVGLGLFIAKAGIEKCGGSIEIVDSTSGCHVRIVLPRTRKAAAAPDSEEGKQR